MRRGIVSTALLGPLLALASCSGRGTSACVYNEYGSDFDSWKSVALRNAHEAFEEGLLLNISSTHSFDGFAVTYYVYGLCADHASYHNVCPNLYAWDAFTFLENEELKIRLHLTIPAKNSSGFHFNYQGIHHDEAKEIPDSVSRYWLLDSSKVREMKDFGFEDDESAKDLINAKTNMLVNELGEDVGDIVFDISASGETMRDYAAIFDGLFQE